ncbi:MAG: hypothetical protein D6780_01450 [Candidatus Dadabacteria bacterium]|nr:MAG: hypothetical protein D6780_01450 [Candidatus Dadabacteria bacterium]
MELKGKIVFSSGKAGDFDIWVLHLEEKSLEQLTSGTYWNDMPRWSPDGEKITFISNRTTIPKLYLMDKHGENQTLLTKEDRFATTPCWFPDGEHVAFCGNFGNPDFIGIYKININNLSKGIEPLLEEKEIIEGIDISSDGTKLLYTSKESGNLDIWEYDLTNGNKRQITTHPSADYSPSYSPDNKYIAFISVRESEGEESKRDSDIWVVPSDLSEKPKRLTTNSGADEFVRWHPSGKYLIYCASSTEGSDARIKLLDIEQKEEISLSYDREALEKEIGAEVKDYGIFTAIMPDFIQRWFVYKSYFGSERYPDWFI